MRRYEAVPHPFALRVGSPPPDRAGSELYLTLFGRGNQHLGLLIYALSRAAEQHNGIGGVHLRLRAVYQETVPGSGNWERIYGPGEVLCARQPAMIEPPPVPHALQVTLRTPLRVKRDGTHVRPEAFRFADFFGSVLRRISMLTYFHSDTPLEADFKALKDLAKSVTVHASLGWKEITRYSARQKAVMKLGGVVGCLEIRHQDLAPFWPYLWLGQWTHAGTAATMGFGHYSLASLPGAQSGKSGVMIQAHEQA